MFAMKQPRKLSNQESQRFENFRLQAPKSKGWWNTFDLEGVVTILRRTRRKKLRFD